jgi:hypothetical protein
MTFEQYLVDVGVRSSEYGFSREELFENIEYFSGCYHRELSAYNALLFLSYDEMYIRRKKLKRILKNK